MRSMAKGRKTHNKPLRRTLRQVFTWGMQPQEKFIGKVQRYFRKTDRHLRYHKRRFTVGYIRAFAGPHLFAGCYPGAEYD